MARLCCFCGNSFTGQKRNREHIISDWLVREADLKKRTMSVHIGGHTFQAAMKRIVGDSCETCNSAFSALEGQAQTAFSKVRKGDLLLEQDAEALLDWLDKVRVGTWLWLLGVSKNHIRITPKFHIDARVGRKDRIVMVARYPARPEMKGLAFWGVGEQFLFQPSAIGLLINNIALVSVSTDFILAQHLRKVRLIWDVNDKAQQTANLKPLSDGESPIRLKILGAPYIFGQCIGPPQALIDELGLEGVSPSPRHPDLVQTKVMALNSDLTPKSGSLDPVRDTFVNMDAHLALMEMNVSLTFEFIFRELLNSNLSEIRKLPEGQGHIEQFNSFLAEQRAYMNVLRERYFQHTGLRLPTD